MEEVAGRAEAQVAPLMTAIASTRAALAELSPITPDAAMVSAFFDRIANDLPTAMEGAIGGGRARAQQVLAGSASAAFPESAAEAPAPQQLSTPETRTIWLLKPCRWREGPLERLAGPRCEADLPLQYADRALHHGIAVEFDIARKRGLLGNRNYALPDFDQCWDLSGEQPIEPKPRPNRPGRAWAEWRGPEGFAGELPRG
jgi:hypothetical protein